jgi:hypothetical protein
MCRVGVGLVLPSKRYNVSNAVAKLRELLDMRDFAKRAQNVALRMRSEDGTRTACDAIEEALITDHDLKYASEGRITLPVSRPNKWRGEYGRVGSVPED